MALIGQDIDLAIDLLDRGEVISIPTETVYGLAGNALNIDTIGKIFSIKNRPYFDPLIIHTHSKDQVSKYVKSIPKLGLKLMDEFWPGPLTILLNKKNIIPDLVTSGLEKVAVRVPDHPLTLKLLENIDYPLAAPSANPFGYISPTSPLHVQEQLGYKIQYILDGGNCKVGLESTIVSINDDEIKIHRYGGLTKELLSMYSAKISIQIEGSMPSAPGMLDQHYSPSKPLIVGSIPKLILENKEKTLLIISFSDKFKEKNILSCLTLSVNKDLNHAAETLFSALRIADQSSADLIIAETVPNIGLGLAINDRLKRASING